MSNTNLPKYRLSRLSGHDIAAKFGLEYCGDISPIPHDGYWYRITPTTKQDGYVDCVRIRTSEDITLIDALTVNIPDATKLKYALDCIGYEEPLSETDAHYIRVAIEACVAYGYYDIDDSYRITIDGEATGVERMTENQALNMAMKLICAHEH